MMEDKNTDYSFFNETDLNMDQFVDRAMEISDRIHEIMQKHNISQKELAEKLGKKESEISKLLSGVHNMTLKSIAKLEVALKHSIILPIHGEEFNKIIFDTEISAGDERIKEFVKNIHVEIQENSSIFYTKVQQGIWTTIYNPDRMNMNILNYVTGVGALRPLRKKLETGSFGYIFSDKD